MIIEVIHSLHVIYVSALEYYFTHATYRKSLVTAQFSNLIASSINLDKSFHFFEVLLVVVKPVSIKHKAYIYRDG